MEKAISARKEETAKEIQSKKKDNIGHVDKNE